MRHFSQIATVANICVGLSAHSENSFIIDSFIQITRLCSFSSPCCLDSVIVVYLKIYHILLCQGDALHFLRYDVY